MKIVANAFVDQGRTISHDHFGAVQTGFGRLSEFEQQFDYLSAGHVRWPGGTLSETQTDVYGLDIPGLFDGTQLWAPDPSRVRPDLTDMLDFAVREGVGISIQIPTARYAQDHGLAQQHLSQFLHDLDSGKFGLLPHEVILELGNEFYALSEFQQDPGAYASLANAMLHEIDAFRTTNPSSECVSALKVGLQMGRTQEEDETIRHQIDDDLLSNVDILIAHHLPYRFEAIDKHSSTLQVDADVELVSRLDLIEWELNEWRALASEVGLSSDKFEYHLTGWTVGEASPHKETNLKFQDIGARQGSTALELLSSHLSIGMSAANVWGVGVSNPNSFSSSVDGRMEVSSGGEAFRMMADSLVGMRLLVGSEEASRSEPFNIYSFRDDGRLVMFVAANNISDDGIDIEIDVSGFGSFDGATVTRLSNLYSSVDPVDQSSPDRRLLEVPVISTETLASAGSKVTVSLGQDYEIIRVAVDLSDPQDVVRGFFGFEAAEGHFGADGNEKVSAHFGSNVLHGNGGDDTLVGGSGRDLLSGGTGNDVLIGDNSKTFFGSDVLEGGTGNDLLSGLFGVDTFVFRPGDGNDTIAEFNLDYTNMLSSIASGPDFDPLLDSTLWIGFGYECRADVLKHVSDVNGHATFIDQGTKVVFFGLSTTELDDMDVVFM